MVVRLFFPFLTPFAKGPPSEKLPHKCRGPQDFRIPLLTSYLNPSKEHYFFCLSLLACVYVCVCLRGHTDTHMLARTHTCAVWVSLFLTHTHILKATFSFPHCCQFFPRFHRKWSFFLILIPCFSIQESYPFLLEKDLPWYVGTEGWGGGTGLKFGRVFRNTAIRSLLQKTHTHTSICSPIF